MARSLERKIERFELDAEILFGHHFGLLSRLRGEDVDTDQVLRAGRHAALYFAAKDGGVVENVDFRSYRKGLADTNS
jgi:hypothetical protein